MTRIPFGIAVLLVIFCAAPMYAQSQEPASSTPPADAGSASAGKAAASQAAQDDPDRDINFAQPDFSLIAWPTTLRVPRHKLSFRVTHRFSRPVFEGGPDDYDNLLDDFFGLDSSGLIGLELRYGLFRGTQVGIYRTSDRTIEFFAQHQVFRQGNRLPFTVDALATAEGTNNFHDAKDDEVFSSQSPALGAVLSREFGEHGAVYVSPIWVNNSNPLPTELADDNDTFMIGLGARVRIRPTVYLVLEGAPRVAGFDDGVTQISFGIEKRAGRHLFQLNFSNSLATTVANIARGAVDREDWYLGFNISRKFF